MIVLLLVLTTLLALGLFALFYVYGILDLIFNALTVIWAALYAFGAFLLDAAVVALNAFGQVFCGPLGAFLLGALILGGLGAVWTEVHDDVFEALDEVHCETSASRQQIAEVATALAPITEIYICFYNVGVGTTRILIESFISLSIDCTDDALWLDFLLQLGKIQLSVSEATLSFLVNPVNNSFPFYSENPLDNDVWDDWVDLIDIARPLSECLCSNSFVQTFVQFAFDALTSENLGCAIHNAINALIAIGQTVLAVFLEPLTAVLDLNLFFNRLCLSVLCLGEWIDETIFELTSFTGQLNINLNLGCIAANSICVVLELLATFTEVTLNFLTQCIAADPDPDFGGCFLPAFIPQLNFAPALVRIEDLAVCVDALFGAFDTCLGESTANTIRLGGAFLEFIAQIVQNGTVAFEIILDAVTNLVGSSRWDDGDDIHLFQSSNYNHPNNPPLVATSLTCLLSRLLGNTECAQAAGDFSHSVIQLIFSPLLLVEDILITDFTDLSISGNPLASGNRNQFDDLILDIVCLFYERLVVTFDTFGHLVECVPGLAGVGDAIIAISETLANNADQFKRLVLLAVEVVAQAIIWVLSILGGSPFGGSAGTELNNFFDLFFAFFIETFDLLLEIVKGLIDFVLFPWFPGIFGQNTLLSNNPGRARFTRCFDEFDDCICGITKVTADKVCLPLDIGCLSDFWPNCGRFNPARQVLTSAFDENGKIIANGTVWEYWADNYQDTFCGEVFERWRDGPDRHTTVGESDGMEFINCLAMVRSSASLANSSEHADIYVNPVKMNNTAHQFGKAMAIWSSAGISNILLTYSDPAAILDHPEAMLDYVELQQELKRMNVTDAVAIQMITGLQELVVNSVNNTQRLFYYPEDDPGALAASSQLFTKSYKLFNAGMAFTVGTLHEMRHTDAFNRVYYGVQNSGYSLYEMMLKKETYQRYEYDRRRSILLQSEDPDKQQVFADGYWPFQITRKAIFAAEAARFGAALKEYSYHLVGLPTYSPKYGPQGVMDEIELATREPNSCTVVEWSCDADLNTGPPIGCDPDPFILPNFRVCNDIFGHSVVTNCGFNDQDQIFVAFNFYDNTQQCELPPDLRPPPDDLIFAGDSPLNDTACLNTTGIIGGLNPDNTDAGILCINEDGCIECPVTNVIPGFECQLLDLFVHKIEFLVRRCIDKFGLGPPKPQIPDNFTQFLLDQIILDQQDLTIGSFCGDGVIDNEERTYRNPQNGLIFTFPSEQCDPPFSINSGCNNSVQCNTACQCAECGNGVIDLDEECDDGNLLNGDGCSASCRIEVCGDGIVDSTGVCRGLAISGFRDTVCDLNEFPTWQAWQADPNLSCGRCRIFSNITDVPCAVGVTPFVDTCPLPFFCFVPDNQDGTFCGADQASCGGADPTLNCEARETCDDGNRISNDGCDRNCQIEVCPTLVYTERYELGDDPLCENVKTPAVGTDRITLNATKPDDCFTLDAGGRGFVVNLANIDTAGSRSAEIDCKADPPVLWIYPNGICDGNERLEEVQIIRECDVSANPFFPPNLPATFPAQVPECALGLFQEIANGCEYAVGVGTEFSCKYNCGFCGNKIVDQFEECDDGTRFPTGNATEDECINCKIPCVCDPDPRVPCRGTCGGGQLNDQPCNVRTAAEEDACNGFDCIPFNCCGDLEEQGVEREENRCDRNPDPTNPENSDNCLFCIEAQCECQPGLPCIGRCWDTSEPVSEVRVPRNQFGFDTNIACDMADEPFACPEPNQVCIPESCCGDGILQTGENGFNTILDVPNLLNAPCEPSLTEVGSVYDPCPADCRYFVGGLLQNELLGPGQLNPTISETLGGETLRALFPMPRRDECTCVPGEVCAGRCYTEFGGFTDTQIFCERDPLEIGFNQQCIDSGVANGYCGAIACCGNEMIEFTTFAGVTVFLEDEFGIGEPSGQEDQPCENTDPFGVLEGCADDECNYGNRWYFFDECTPVTNKSAMGRCSINNDNTNILCDPVGGEVKSPWCPFESDISYTCVPIACCGDGNLLPKHGKAGAGFFEDIIDPLEDAESSDSTCGTQNNTDNCDCGITENMAKNPEIRNVPPALWTQCECQPGFPCVGFCADTNGHIIQSIAGNTFCNPNGSPCLLGTCYPQACCGDGINQWLESADLPANISAGGAFEDCGLMPPARKRSVEVVQQKRSMPVKDKVYLVRRQAITLTADDSVQQLFFDIWDWIFEQLGLATSSGDIESTVLDFFTRYAGDVNAPLDEWGALDYLGFPFTCEQPQKTSCENGVGTIQALTYLFFYGIIALLVVGFAFYSCPGLSSCFLYVFVILGFVLFPAIAWFYAVPACIFPTVYLPECFVWEIANVTNEDWFSGDCFPWLEEAVLVPSNGSCPDSCERELVDCKAEGFVDGFDSLIYLLNVYLPGLVEILDGTNNPVPSPGSQTNIFLFALYLFLQIGIYFLQLLFQLLVSFDFFALKFARFDYGGADPPPLDTWCWKVTLINISQVFLFGILLFGIGAVLVQIATALADRLFYLFGRIEYLIFRENLSRKFDDLQPLL